MAGGEKEAIQSLLDVVKRANRNFTFTDREIPGADTEIRRQLGAAFLAGNPPEVYQANVGMNLKPYVDANRLKPLDDIWAAINGERIFSSGVKKAVTINGHVYAIPLNTHVITQVFYNKKVFDKFGLKEPKNWTEFQNVCAVLKRNNIEPFAMFGKTTPIYTFFPFLLDSLGPEGFLNLGSGKIAFTDAKVRKAFEDYGKILVPNMMFGWAGYGWPEAAAELMKGNAAMYINGDWVASYFETNGWKPGVDYDYFPAPGTGNIIVVQIDGLAAPVAAKDSQGARAFLLSAGGADAQAAFNKYKGSVAANLNVSRNTYSGILQKTYDRIQAVSKNGYVLPNLAIMFPPALWEEIKTQNINYALTPDARTLDRVLNTLERVRQESLKKNEFVDWN
jgi:ABC-type glycerol-3-phosphate transport system substrate-binding protein